MKNLIYSLVLLVVGSAMAQEKPTEVKEETKVKVVKTKNSDDASEHKVKVITRETANVKLDKSDKNLVNQERVPATKKVEKMVMLDHDNDSDYDALLKETFFEKEGKTYKFSPNKKGFDIIFDNNNKEFVKVSKVWRTHSKGNFIVNGKEHDGIGYFNKEGAFVVEYYDKDSNSIKTITYTEKNIDM